MTINDKHEIIVVVVEKLENGNYGDIYESFDEFKEAKPNSSYFFGYCITDKKTGLVPDGFADLFETVEDALLCYLARTKLKKLERWIRI